MKIKVISVLFILVCIGIISAGCNSPSQSNYQQPQSQSSSYQNPSQNEPIVGCWITTSGSNGYINEFKYNIGSDNKGYYDAWYQTPGKPKTLTGRTQFTWRKPSGNYPYRLYTDESKNEGFEFIYDPNSQTIEPIQPSLAQKWSSWEKTQC